MKIRASLKYFGNDYFWEHIFFFFFFAFTLSQISPNLISLKVLVTPRCFTFFNLKSEQLKVSKFALFDNSFSDLLSEVELSY